MKQQQTQIIETLTAYHRAQSLARTTSLVADEALEAAIRELSSGGLSIRQIAQALEVSASSVFRTLRDDSPDRFASRRQPLNLDAYEQIRTWAWGERRTE